MDRKALPVFELADALVRAARTVRRLIIQAPTGSGKSTQVPQMLLDAGVLGDGAAVVLEPRRLAARLLAARVARERGGAVGGEVGHEIRFDRAVSANTRIRYVTEGVLLRQLIADPRLTGVGAVILDEFHERHLYGDVALAQALALQESARPELLVIVMSATLDSGRLREYMAPCAALEARGRTYPVAVRYLERRVDFNATPVWEAAAAGVAQVARETGGDILVFMPGVYEIRQCVRAVAARLNGFEVLPLYGELSAADQDRAVAKTARRKVVVATNVAESSITIDGIEGVVDSGLARVPRFDPHRGLDMLWVGRISRASADQRAGRAGRTAPGLCLRLWTEREHGERPAHDLPEVLRLDLAEVALALKGAGIADLRSFRWLEPPGEAAVARAEQLLADLGAIGREPPGPVTALGRQMLAFPTHPRLARMLLAAVPAGIDCVKDVALACALTQGRPILLRGATTAAAAAERDAAPRGDRSADGAMDEDLESDFVRLLRAWEAAHANRFEIGACDRLGVHAGAAREAGQLASQLLRVARNVGRIGLRDGAGGQPPPAAAAAAGGRSTALGRCILAGFSDQVAARLDQGTLRCRLVHGRTGVLSRDSAVRTAPLLVAVEAKEIGGRDGAGKVTLAMATAIREEWLAEMFPDDLTDADEVRYDPVQRRVVTEWSRRFRDLPLRQGQTECRDPNRAAAALAAQITAGVCPLTAWDQRVEQWIVRLRCVRRWRPELELPDLDDDGRRALLEQICHGATSYREIKDRPVWETVTGWLSAAQRGLVERFAPERVELPGGRRAKVTYDETGSPTIAARIQDLFGLAAGIAVGGGRVPVAIKVLAPNERPVQITDDLGRFWRETYPELRRQLARRYPRHAWPENPS